MRKIDIKLNLKLLNFKPFQKTIKIKQNYYFDFKIL